jgi:hypothetical protein
VGTNFSWGFSEPSTTTQVQTSTETEFVVREALRQSSTASSFPPLTASASAQGSTGLGIQNIKRGFLNLQVPYDSSVVGVDFQTSSTSFADVSAELTGSMQLSGRPVAITVRCRESGSLTGSQVASFSVRIGNAEVTGSEGILRLAPSSSGTATWFATPDAGTSTFAMVWKVSGGTAIMPRSWRPSLTVVEI